MIFYIKEIFYNNQFFNIVLQQQNGPCPLVTICNIFILRGILSISSKTTVTSEQLLTALHSIILDILDKKVEQKQKYEDKYSSVIDVLNSLETGINVDIKFDSVKSFVSGPASDLFSLCGIQLIHGWVPDPKGSYAMISKLSYNAVEEELSIKNSMIESESNNQSIPKEDTVTETLLDTKHISAEELLSLGFSFMTTFSSQLTPYALQYLQTHLKQDELFAFFRNNHISVLINHNHQLYTLITDIGYANRSACVWERLDSVTSTTLCMPDFITPYHDVPISESIPEETVQSISEIPQEVIGMSKSIEEIHKEQLDIEQTIIQNSDSVKTISKLNDSSNGLPDLNASERTLQVNDDARIAELLQAEEYEEAEYQKKKCTIM